MRNTTPQTNRAQRAARILISGGGTGGHVFPAIAIADAVRERLPDAEILFVGAKGRIEMEKVPKAGYRIEGLWISGFQRRLTWQNLLFPVKLLSSLWKARQVVRRFRPDVVVGVGGYASGPVLRVATSMGIPALIQEQNSWAGVTNRLLANRVQRVCVAYEGMERFFPAEKIVLTGNPVRADLLGNSVSKVEAAAHFGLSATAPTIFVFGGSLGALALNEAVAASAEAIAAHSELQVLWQVGKLYEARFSECDTARLPNVRVLPFVDRMDLAYSLADVVVCRAGALTISELCAVGKPAILIPSPNVAEDHQTQNALALTRKGAAVMIPNAEARQQLFAQALALLQDKPRCQTLAGNIRALARPDAAARIAQEVIQLAGWADATANATNLLSLDAIRKVYCIGIGGIGMSALARYFQGRGVQVWGYDKTKTALTQALEQEGIAVHYDDTPERIPPGIDLAIYTPAVPADLGELQYFRQSTTPLMKRAEVLGVISRGMKTIAIAGTHGKTTTSSLTTWLLRSSGVDCSAFLGGIVSNLGSNFVQGHSEWVVVEADEYDRSFLYLDPDVAVILSMDADHLDIYGSPEQVVETGYKAFAQKLKPGGMLFVQHHWADAFAQATSFGVQQGECSAEQVRVEEGFFVFDYVSPVQRFEGLRLAMPGRHNVENAIAAISAALCAGATEAGIRLGLQTFGGIKRRFEILHRDAQHVYVDDYAHHPTELEAVIGAAREFFPGRKITGIFQPHLYTRTRDFARGFARALDMLDEAWLLDIYPARELPLPGITSDTIAVQMQRKPLRLTKEQVLDTLSKHPVEVLLTLGAGDIDTLVDPIKAWMTGATVLENQKTHTLS